MKRIISVMLTIAMLLTMFTVSAGSADVTAISDTNYTGLSSEKDNIVHYEEYIYVEGKVDTPRGYVTILIRNNKGGEKQNGICHIGQTAVSSDGTYSFKVPFSPEQGYSISDYTITLNKDGRAVNNSVTTAKTIRNMVTADCAITNNADGTFTATAKINKSFTNAPDGTYSIKLILAFYNKANQLCGVAVLNDNSTEVTDEEITMSLDAPAPKETETVKAFAFEAFETFLPLTENAEYYSNLYNISCWGDSITAGAGANGGKSYPLVLQDLIDAGAENKYTVYNMGVGGETVSTIAARQGGITMNLVNTVVIPAETEEVEVALIGSDGNEIIPLAFSSGPGINPCTINGISGTLSRRDDDSGIHYYFTRSESGEKKLAKAGTAIITAAMRERNKDIVVILAGHNGFGKDMSVLFDTIDSMLASLDYDEPKYIVIGITSHTGNHDDVNAIGQYPYNMGILKDTEAKMEEKYGEHFLNLREYMISEQAFTDAALMEEGFEPSDADKAMQESGYVPGSFRSDGIHYNALGYKLLGNQVYKKLTELGYVK